MRVGWLDIYLVSELCTATGSCTAGLIDTEIAHEYGLPVIPAKRIKGALREVGKELVDWGVVEEAQLAALFGSAGQATSAILQVYDAHLYGIPGYGIIEDYEELCSQLKRQDQLKANDVLAQFTDVHTHTAIDGATSIVDTGTLRSIRVVNKGITMRCKLELAEDDNTLAVAVEETLRMCVKGLRQLGLANTRGYGEVKCKLAPLEVHNSQQSNKSSDYRPLTFDTSGNEHKAAPFRLELEQPVIIAGSDGLYHNCKDWIPGSALLGAIAAMYVDDYQLGERAHEDETFSRIFLRGGVQFGYALPLVGGKVFAPCPAMWQQVKNTDRGYNLSNGVSPAAPQLRSIGDMVYLDWQQGKSVLNRYKSEKQVRMHHARASNRAIGRALGTDITAAERAVGAFAVNAADRGQLFQHVSLDMGRQFAGTLRGKARDIDVVLACLYRRDNRLRIGRSRTAEYGNVRFFSEGSDSPLLCPAQDERPINRLALYLVTPMLLLDDAGRADPDPRWLTEQINNRLNCEAKVQAQRLKYTVLSGFNTKWRLPKPHRPALDAGSSIVLAMKRSLSPKELEAVLWGWNVGEGDGQVRAIPVPVQESTKFTIKPSSSTVSGYMANEASGRHAFLIYLYELQEQNERQRQDRVEGMAAAEQVDEKSLEQVGQTKLQQLVAWAGQEGSYERINDNVNLLKKEAEQEACRRIIAPCADKSKAFIFSYLRILELKARQRR